MSNIYLERIQKRHEEANEVINKALANIHKNLSSEGDSENEKYRNDDDIRLNEKIDKISSELDDLLKDL